jgi:hypothetical protein
MTTWHAGRILEALAHYFDWQRNFLMPEYEIGGRADLVVITRARYVTEVEIKISLADWRADRDKIKWRLDKVNSPVDKGYLSARRAHISRFFYAIPETLEHKIPADLPVGVGIIVVRDQQNRYGHDRIDVLREAVRRKSTPISEQEFNRIMLTCYHRYWHVLRNLQRSIRYREQIREMAARA